MARRKAAVKRERLPDPKFGSQLVTQFVNGIMLQGKKSIAEYIVYQAIDELQAKAGTEETGLDVLKRALEIDERENKMVPMIKQQKSLSKVIAIFNRI